MCDKNPECNANETNIEANELICSECGVVVDNDPFEQPWQAGEALGDFDSRRPRNRRHLGGVIDRSDPEARRNRRNRDLIRTERRNREHARSQFERELIEIIDSLNETPEVKRRLEQLIDQLGGLVGSKKLGKTRLHPKGLSSKERALMKRRAYIVWAMKRLNQEGIPIDTESYQDDWAIEDVFQDRIIKKFDKIMKSVTRPEQTLYPKGQNGYLQHRRIELNRLLSQARGKLDQLFGIQSADTLIRHTEDFLAALGEPIKDPNSQNIGETCNLGISRLIVESICRAAQELNYTAFEIKQIRKAFGFRGRRFSDAFTRALAAAEAEEE